MTPEALRRVRYPAGLDLGGMEPPEIALSILAEIVAVRSGKTGSVGGAQAPAVLPGPPRVATDPVCAMKVQVEGALYVTEREGDSVYFCCPMCQAAFEKDPAAYAVATAD